MKKAALEIIAIAALIGTPALAADMALKAPPPAPAWSWTGFYIGVDAGYTGNNVGIFDPAVPSGGTATLYSSSATFGGHLGYLYQFKNPLVLGVEGDASWLNGTGNGPFPGVTSQGILATSHWDASARGIAGFAVDPRALVYGTGGWSWLNGSMCGVASFPTPLTCAPGTNGPGTRGGWIVGAGVAYAFTDNLIFRIEYLHADYGPFSYTGTAWTGGTVLNVTDTTDTVRVGLSWKF